LAEGTAQLGEVRVDIFADDSGLTRGLNRSSEKFRSFSRRQQAMINATGRVGDFVFGRRGADRWDAKIDAAGFLGGTDVGDGTGQNGSGGGGTYVSGGGARRYGNTGGFSGSRGGGMVAGVGRGGFTRALAGAAGIRGAGSLMGSPLAFAAVAGAATAKYIDMSMNRAEDASLTVTGDDTRERMGQYQKQIDALDKIIAAQSFDGSRVSSLRQKAEETGFFGRMADAIGSAPFALYSRVRYGDAQATRDQLNAEYKTALTAQAEIGKREKDAFQAQLFSDRLDALLEAMNRLGNQFQLTSQPAVLDAIQADIATFTQNLKVSTPRYGGGF
jgi:hypothetical protein